MSLPLGIAFIVVVIGIVFALLKPRTSALLGALLGVIAIFSANSFDTNMAREQTAEIHSIQSNLEACAVEAKDKSTELQATLGNVATELSACQESLANKEVELLQERTRTEEEKEKAAAAVAALDRDLKAALEKVAKLECKSLDCEITFAGGEYLFRSGSATLDCDKREALAKLSGFLFFKFRTGLYSIDIIGHTDNTGPAGQEERYNQRLSEARAEAVKAYLHNAGIPEEIKITARGLGMTQPAGFDSPQSADVIANANRSEQARARNRRVSIAVVSQ